METFTESLSFDGQFVPNNQITFEEQNSGKSNNSIHQTPTTSSLRELLLKDQTAAAMTVQQLLSSVRALRTDSVTSLSTNFISPFDKLKLEYLEPSYQCLTLDEIPLPLDFCITTSIQQLTGIQKNFNSVAHKHCEHILTNTNAITCANLGHAFAELSSTANGDQFIINKERYANQIKFADFIMNLQLDQVEKMPVAAAQKIIQHFVSLHS